MIGLIVCAGSVYGAFSYFSDERPAGIPRFGGTGRSRGDIYQQVADNRVKEYEIAKRSGSAMDVCVQAGIVSAAFLQKMDEEGYGRWKEIEKRDCSRAGVPR